MRWRCQRLRANALLLLKVRRSEEAAVVQEGKKSEHKVQDVLESHEVKGRDEQNQKEVLEDPDGPGHTMARGAGTQGCQEQVITVCQSVRAQCKVGVELARANQ